MDGRVGRVAELLQDQVTVRIGGDDLFGLGDSAFHAFRPFGQHQIGAERLEQLRRSMLMVSGMVSVSL